MDEVRGNLTQWLASSELREVVVYLLSNVPGLPPIVQSVHLLGVAVVMASVVLFSLRTLGIAAPGQGWREMQTRLLPWLWWLLPVMILTGGMFVVARPARYFYNPVFGIKVVLLVVVLLTTWLLGRMQSDGPAARLLAGGCLVLWIGVVFAGRWIAYADYLFPWQ